MSFEVLDVIVRYVFMPVVLVVGSPVLVVSAWRTLRECFSEAVPPGSDEPAA